MTKRGILTLLSFLIFPAWSQAGVVDITSSGSSSASVNGATFEQFNLKTGGTGAVNSFLRVQAKGNATIQKGYNTGFPRNNFPSGFPDFSQKSGNFTVTVPFGEVPKEGAFRALLLDLNEKNGPGGSVITLERFQVYIGADLPGSGMTFIDGDENQLSSLGTLVYDLDAGDATNAVKMEDFLSGSGEIDVRILLPESLFNGVSSAAAFRIFVEFSGADAGFEEFIVQGIGGGPGDGGEDPPIPPGFVVPEAPGFVIWGMMACLTGVVVFRRRRRLSLDAA